MYELTIRTCFRATHAITIAGDRETPHEHDWATTVTVAGDALDDDGLVCDFHELEARLEAIVAPFRDRDLNTVAPFDAIPPTAELVARHIGDSMAAALPGGVVLRRVTVMEAPGCEASWVETGTRAGGGSSPAANDQ